MSMPASKVLITGADGQVGRELQATTPPGWQVTACGIGARLIHLSTDFVFDGARGQPYAPEDQPAPLGVYGRTKLEGERAALSCSRGQALVLRTAWVYAAHGRNFVRTMLRLMTERDSLGV